MENYLKESIKELIALRASLFNVVIVLTGGLLSLLLLDAVPWILRIFAVIGVYFDITFLKNIVNITEDIRNKTKELKKCT